MPNKKCDCEHIRYYGSYCGYELGLSSLENAKDYYRELLKSDYKDYCKEKDAFIQSKADNKYHPKCFQGNFPFKEDLWDWYNLDLCLIEFSYCPRCGEKLKKGLLKKFFATELEKYQNSFEEIFVDNEKIKSLQKEITKTKKAGYVYLVKLDKHYKIGISKTPEQRLKEFTMLPYKLEDIKIARVNEYEKVEKELHEKYKSKKVRGEWFELIESEVKEIVDYLTEIEL